jgi:hypothetical protein
MVCCQPAGGLLCSAPAKLLLNVSLILIGPDGCGGARLCQPRARRHQQPLFHFLFAGRLIIVFCVGLSGTASAQIWSSARATLIDSHSFRPFALGFAQWDAQTHSLHANKHHQQCGLKSEKNCSAALQNKCHASQHHFLQLFSVRHKGCPRKTFTQVVKVIKLPAK